MFQKSLGATDRPLVLPAANFTPGLELIAYRRGKLAPAIVADGIPLLGEHIATAAKTDPFFGRCGSHSSRYLRDVVYLASPPFFSEDPEWPPLVKEERAKAINAKKH